MCVLLASGYWIVGVKHWNYFFPSIQFKAPVSKTECQNNVNSFIKSFGYILENVSLAFKLLRVPFHFKAPHTSSYWCLTAFCFAENVLSFTVHLVFYSPNERRLIMLSVSVSCSCCLSQITFKTVVWFHPPLTEVKKSLRKFNFYRWSENIGREREGRPCECWDWRRDCRRKPC